MTVPDELGGSLARIGRIDQHRLQAGTVAVMNFERPRVPARRLCLVEADTFI